MSAGGSAGGGDGLKKGAGGFKKGATFEKDKPALFNKMFLNKKYILYQLLTFNVCPILFS
jgi:hypothetical protein